MAPTFRHGKAASFELDSTAGSLVNLSSGLDSISLSRAMDTAEVTTFGDSWKNYIVGLRGATISCSGHFSSTHANLLDGVFADATSTSYTFKYCPESTAATSHTLTGECLMTSLEYGAAVGDKVTMSFELIVTGVVTSTNE
jgi:predicted secreted protein